MAKKKIDYNEVAKNIIRLIGGKENVSSVRHCITRVRFKLKDESIADDEAVQNLEGVVSVVHGGGEYMVVIGPAVEECYEAVCAQLGMADGVRSEEESEEGGKQNPVMKLLNVIVGAVGPCLNLICAGGILKGLLTLLQMTNLVAADSGVYALINASADAVFFFLPIFLGTNMAKTLKGDPFLGALLGAVLCYPGINGTDLTLFGRTFNYTYTSSFLPVIALVACAVPLSKLLARVLPKAVEKFLTPALTLLITVPLGYIIIGPLVSFVGNLVNTGITSLMNAVPLLGGLIFGGLYQIMILFGVHSALTSFSFMNVLSGNPDAVMAIACTVSFAQTGVVLAMYLKTKDENLKDVSLPAFISCVFGITEPAIYGVTLPRIKMFILSCIGGAVCGAFIMMTGTLLHSFSGLGVFAILGLLNPENPNVIIAVLCAVVPFVFSFILAWLLYRDEEVKEIAAAEESKEVNETIEAPVPGKVVPLSEVPDETFSAGLLGHGFAVEPTEGKVYAPFDGECVMLFETLHAIGLVSDQGVQLLIHVGIDTVNLSGRPFKAHVKSGDKIKKGQLLLEFDIEAIKAAGLPVITPVLVTNESEVGEASVENNRIVINAA